MFHSRNTEANYGSSWWPSGEKPVTRPFTREGGAIEIGKINLILIGLIVVILFALIAKEEPTPAFSHPTPRLQTQIVPAAAPEAEIASPEVGPERPAPEVEPPVLPKVTSKTSDKQPKKVEAAPALDSGPVVNVHISQAPSIPDKVNAEPVSPEDASTKMLIFNIWSVSELRLRSAYTAFMNDSALSPSQVEARKKSYLSFVTQRSRKCGELDNKFTSNINTAEKLSFNKGDVDVLECHAAENNIELDKLNAHG